MVRQMAHFRYNPVKYQKMVKLPESPDPGFCDMNGGIVVVPRETSINKRQIVLTAGFVGYEQG